MEKKKVISVKLKPEAHKQLKIVCAMLGMEISEAIMHLIKVADKLNPKTPQEIMEKLETFNKQVNYLYNIVKLTIDFSSPPLMCFSEKSIVSTYDDTIIIEMEKYANILRIGDIVKIGTKKCLVLDFSSSFGSSKIQVLAIHKEELNVQTNK